MFETVKMLASGLGIASKEQTTLYGLPLEQQRLPFDSTQMATCSSFGNTASICLYVSWPLFCANNDRDLEPAVVYTRHNGNLPAFINFVKQF